MTTPKLYLNGAVFDGQTADFTMYSDIVFTHYPHTINSLTNKSYVDNAVASVPAGATGAQGAAGRDGSTGATGLQGAQGESGPISTITAGNNIDNVGTSADPIIQLQSPLTTVLNMGAVAITDSAASTGTAGQVLSCGAGATTLWTTPTLPAVSSISTSYTSITTNNTWTKLATIVGTTIFSGTGNYSLNWGFSSTETNKFNAIMAIGSSSQFRPFFNIFSYDGITWNPINSARTIGSGGSAEKSLYNAELGLWFSGGGRVGVTVAATAPFYLSKNGIDWNVLAFPFRSSGSSRIVATNGTGTFVYGGSGNSNILATSVGDLGKLPTLIPLVADGPGTSYGTLGLIWVAGLINKFVMTGGGGTTQNSMYSSDGITWLLSTNFNTGNVPGRVLQVDTAQSFIVSGGGTFMKYSTDGINWNNGVVAGTIIDTRGLAFGNGIWVRVGLGTDPLHYSNDGINWIIATATGLTEGYGVVYYSSIGQWIIGGVGTSSIYTSPDAITWTAITASDYFAPEIYALNLAQGVITTPKNMEVGIVVTDTTTATSHYPLNYGVNGGNGLGRQSVFDSASGSASASDTINITSYNAGTMDIEIWGKLDTDTPISFGTSPTLTATISAVSI